MLQTPSRETGRNMDKLQQMASKLMDMCDYSVLQYKNALQVYVWRYFGLLPPRSLVHFPQGPPQM